MASVYLTSGDIPTIAFGEMQVLRDRAQETVSLYVRDGHERVRVQRAEGPLAVRRVVGLGERLPLYLGASGKALLAWAPPPERVALLDQILPPGFDRTGLEATLQVAIQQGWAVSVEEREGGVASVAAPVLDRAGRCAAALAISGPVNRFGPEAAAALGQMVKLSARTIGLRL